MKSLIPKNLHNSGHTFIAFDKIVEGVGLWLRGKVPNWGNYKINTIYDCVLQRIVAIGRIEFTKLCAWRLESGNGFIPEADEKLHLDGILIDQISGEVRIGLRFRIKQFFIFTRDWIVFLKHILLGISTRPIRVYHGIAIAYGIPINEELKQGEDEEFVRFCRDGPVLPLADAQLVLIQAPSDKASLSDPSIRYAVDPIRALVKDCELGFYGRGELLLTHLLLLFKFSFLVIRYPLVALLARDVVYLRSIAMLDERKLIDSVIITDSNFNCQPLWMREPDHRHFRTHFVHYSQNSKPLAYAYDDVVAHVPEHRFVRVDEHWVWTNGYSDFLRNRGHDGPTHVVGPILFYLPPIPSPTENKDIIITVFDITPIPDDHAATHAVINNYYSTAHMIQFVDGIVEVCGEIGSEIGAPMRILIKQKRGFIEGLHDWRYKDHIEKLMMQRKIEIVEYNVNLYSLLSQSDLSISIPYTSVAYLASSQKTNSIYFDPTRELLPSHESAPYIYFASGVEELMNITRSKIGDLPIKNTTL
jgi:hypothetical protein